jgi:hypothetical protein
MKLNDAYPGNYLKADDLQGRQILVTIDRVQLEEMSNDKKKKPVCYFKGKSKGLVLNKTNFCMIGEIAGTDETDEWGGNKITLKVAKVDFQGKRVDAIRVDYPNGSQPPPVKADDEDGSDLIPF